MSAWTCRYLTARLRVKIVAASSSKSHDGRALVPISEEKQEPASDISTLHWRIV